MENTVNAHLKQPQPVLPIVATLASDEDTRLECLPTIAGSRCVMLEYTIYNMLARMTADYSGGYWDFYTLSNGGFYMAPRTATVFHFSCENLFEGDIDADTAGVIACAMAYSHLSFLPEGECFAKAYCLLSDFIYQHKEVRAIRAALD